MKDIMVDNPVRFSKHDLSDNFSTTNKIMLDKLEETNIFVSMIQNKNKTNFVNENEKDIFRLKDIDLNSPSKL